MYVNLKLWLIDMNVAVIRSTPDIPSTQDTSEPDLPIVEGMISEAEQRMVDIEEMGIVRILNTHQIFLMAPIPQISYGKYLLCASQTPTSKGPLQPHISHGSLERPVASGTTARLLPSLCPCLPCVLGQRIFQQGVGVREM